VEERTVLAAVAAEWRAIAFMMLLFYSGDGVLAVVPFYQFSIGG